MSRERLANRRASETFSFRCNGMPYSATVSRFSDGRLTEIFISNGKAGSDADAAARDSGIVCSIALQFGAPVETIRRALLRNSRGVASSPLGIALDSLADENPNNPPAVTLGDGLQLDQRRNQTE